MTSNHFLRGRKNPSRPCFVSSFEIKTLLFIFVVLLYKTNRFHLAVRLFSYRSQTHSPIGSWATFLFLPHFDVICDLKLNGRTAKWNLFVK